jgi:hypothetical protein
MYREVANDQGRPTETVDHRRSELSIEELHELTGTDLDGVVGGATSGSGAGKATFKEFTIKKTTDTLSST